MLPKWPAYPRARVDGMCTEKHGVVRPDRRVQERKIVEVEVLVEIVQEQADLIGTSMIGRDLRARKVGTYTEWPP